jgi:hypothetical protein
MSNLYREPSIDASLMELERNEYSL